MKICLLLAAATAMLAWTAPANAAEASASPSPTAVPSDSPVSDVSSPTTPAADAPAAPAASPAAPLPAPAAAPDETPLPATPTPAPGEPANPAGNVEDALPQPSPNVAPQPGATLETPGTSPDADFLPNPDDLGAPVPQPDVALPSDDVPANDLPNPDDLLIPGGDDLPPAPPRIVENEFQKERELRVRYQEVKLQALKDPAVRSFKEQADAARSDEAKRQALRAYYRALFARMTAIDAKLEKKCVAMQEAYLRRLGQYRVAPTIPLQPPPTPAPLENES